jgi:hypothetical protein
MACRGNKLRGPSPDATARRYRRAIGRSATASVFPVLGVSPLAAAPAVNDNELKLASGSRRANARVLNLTQIESCPSEIQALP